MKKEKQSLKRLLAMFLSAVLLVTLLPAESLMVFADSPSTQSASGDADDESDIVPQNDSSSGITIVGINGEEYHYNLATGTSFNFNDIYSRMASSWPQYFGYTDANGVHHVANTTVGCDFNGDGEIEEYYNSNDYFQSQDGMKIYLQSEEAYALRIHNFLNVTDRVQTIYVPKENGAIS
ncbi:MAG: hypothetical protein K6E64_09160, partial [Lachnospiraceae bacterium]|nr:hypothetical protein [Lachnospiraceae bacterium]